MREIGTLPWSSGGALGLKLTCLPSVLPSALDALREATAQHGFGVRVRGQAGNGVLYAGVERIQAEHAAQLVAELRGSAAMGSVVVLEAPPQVRRMVDAWGPIDDALPLMRRVKEQFDPGRVLNPGRFVGGI